MNTASLRFLTPPFAPAAQAQNDFPGTHTTELERLLQAFQGQNHLLCLLSESPGPTENVATYLSDELAAGQPVASVGAGVKGATDLSRAICAALNIASPDIDTPFADHISQALTARPGAVHALVINDAHDLPESLLQQLLALASPAPEAPPLGIKILLIGQPALRKLLEQTATAPLSTDMFFTLQGLSELDTIDHVRKRLALAGWKGALPFELAALKRIHASSKGVPAKINVVCQRALNKAQETNSLMITDAIVASVLGQPAPLGSALQSPSTEQHARERAPIVAERLSAASAMAARTPRRWGPWAAAGVVLAMLAGGFVGYANEPAQTGIASNRKQVASGVVSETPAVVPTAAEEPAPVAVAPGAAVETNPPPATGPEPTPSAPEVGPAPKLTSLSDKVAVEWAGIGKLWSLDIDGERACDHALEQGHQCFRLIGSNLETLKDLDRPGLAQLQENGTRRWVQVIAWRNDLLTLAADGQQWNLSSDVFGKQWTGRFTTLWRQPLDQTKRILAARLEEPAGKWLDSQLQKLQASGDLPSALGSAKDRIAAFENQHGLPRKGFIMPVTFIKANQLTAVKEPRLTR